MKVQHNKIMRHKRLTENNEISIAPTPKSLFLGLCITGIILTPILSIQSVIGLFQGTISSQTLVTDLVFIKLLKDVIFVLIFLVGFYSLVKSGTVKPLALFLLILITFIAMSSTILSSGNSFLALASGYRWIIPILIPLVTYKFCDTKTLEKLSHPILTVFLIHLLIQIMQLFFAGHWYGTSPSGLTLRSPGIFLIPQTGAFFSLISLYFTTFFAPYSKRFKLFMCLLAALSIYLTASASSLVLLAFFFLVMCIPRRYFLILLPISIPIIGLALIFSGPILGRPDDFLIKSGGTRLEIFLQFLWNAPIISNQFGHATNTAVLLGQGIIVDSWITSLLGNTGILGLTVFLIVLIPWMLTATINVKKESLILLAVIFGFSAVTIWTEAFPMNLILGVVLAYHLQAQRSFSRLFGSESNRDLHSELN